MKLELGQIVEATMATGVCEKGERGVVYEIYHRPWGRGEEQGAPGVSVIFEAGRYDGFSPNEQKQMLKPVMIAHPVFGSTPDMEPLFDNRIRDYKFINVGILNKDYSCGLFNFHPEDR